MKKGKSKGEFTAQQNKHKAMLERQNKGIDFS